MLKSHNSKVEQSCQVLKFQHVAKILVIYYITIMIIIMKDYSVLAQCYVYIN